MKKVSLKSRVKKPKISILVPTYNVEKYLPECLDSIVNQTLRDIEIICINDGSTDNSPDIIKQYAKKDQRIVIINKANSGYGDSMNKGLAKATGEYVGIVESDDWIEPNMFEKLYSQAAKHGKPDVVKSNFYHYYGKTGKNEKYIIIPEDEDNQVVDIKDFDYILTAKPSIWSAIYRRDFLTKNQISFQPTPGASYQDIGWTIKNYLLASNVLLLSDAYLHYRIDNAGSSVNNVDKKINCAFDEYHGVEKFMKEKNLLSRYGKLINRLKFDNYYWTYDNLSPKLAGDYIVKFSDEFKKAERDGLLDFNLFDTDKANILRKIIDNPASYHKNRYFHAAKRKVRNLARAVAHKISPGYRKLVVINRELAEIRRKYRSLEEKVKEYEKSAAQKSKS
jgi:glycosyltransferase involved in cell wall biosynthesis